MSKPFWLAKIFVKFPWIVVVVSWVIMACFLGIVGIFNLFAMSESSGRDFLVWSDVKVKNHDQLVLAREDLNDATESDAQSQRTVKMDTFTLLFECDKECDTLLTVSALKQIYDAEEAVKGSSLYSTFCKAATPGPCDDTTYSSITEEFTA